MMNYSDYDSDGYSSNEDADYVPSDDNLSEDDINECEKEDPLHEDDSVPHPRDGSRKKSKKSGITKRNRRVLKIDKEDKDGGEAEEAGQSQEEVEKPTKGEVNDDVRAKKKSDDLWASFLSDVGPRPKEIAHASELSTTQKVDYSEVKDSSLQNTATKSSTPAKVTITKVFDFAGEEVRVNKDVLADSREAKSYLKRLCTKQEESEEEKTCSSPSQPLVPGPSKQPAGMSGILNRIGGKKQKMSTLEKSKMDWDAFKSEEGIEEELAIHNRGKEGYVERKNFLDRVDHRQFELEKAVRLSNMKQ